MSQSFQRNIEDFRCEHCGEHVKGNGYTNHCPTCLYSKHVDISPGDRAATCGGLMEPIQVEQTGEGYELTHQCQKCGHTKINRSDALDDFEVLVALAKELAEKKFKNTLPKGK